MNHILKTVNLTEETDLSLEQLDTRLEFLAAPGVTDGFCWTFTCGVNK